MGRVEKGDHPYKRDIMFIGSRGDRFMWVFEGRRIFSYLTGGNGEILGRKTV